MHCADMANKQMFSNRIDTDLTDALKAEALAEHRSVANMLELILRERYFRALTDAGDIAPVRPYREAEGLRSPIAPASVSADVAATIPGVKLASSVCGVSPPGRSRPACSLDGRHVGKHSWEA